MGTVYQALDRDTGGRVALKIVRVSAHDARFEREPALGPPGRIPVTLEAGLSMASFRNLGARPLPANLSETARQMLDIAAEMAPALPDAVGRFATPGAHAVVLAALAALGPKSDG